MSCSRGPTGVRRQVSLWNAERYRRRRHLGRTSVGGSTRSARGVGAVLAFTVRVCPRLPMDGQICTYGASNSEHRRTVPASAAPPCGRPPHKNTGEIRAISSDMSTPYFAVEGPVDHPERGPPLRMVESIPHDSWASHVERVSRSGPVGLAEVLENAPNRVRRA
jgi:hypothetical protein